MIPRTGMLMLDVGMLSGFTLAPDAVSVGDLIRKVEILPGTVSIYLDSVSELMCTVYIFKATVDLIQVSLLDMILTTCHMLQFS